MTTIISSFQGYTGPILRYQPPVSDGLVAWHFVGQDAARTRKNHAGADGTIVGTPEYFPGYARMRAQANYLQTDADETDAMTILAVSRAPDPGSSNGTIGIIAGNAILNASGFALAYRVQGAALSLEVRRAYDNAGAVASMALQGFVVTPNQWDCLAFDLPASGPLRVTSLTRNVFGETAAIANPIKGGKIRAGSALNTWSGQVDLALLGVARRVLSTAEKATAYAAIRQAMTGVGITV